MIEMHVSSILLEPQTRNPIIMLRDTAERRALVIWIGTTEAQAIIHALDNITTPRPTTHDLFANTLERLGVTVNSVVINRMEEQTFFAVLNVTTRDGKQLEIDARPSDAIAIGLRMSSPVFVSEEVMISSAMPINQAEEEKERKDFKDFIRDLKPSDFLRQSQERDGEPN